MRKPKGFILCISALFLLIGSIGVNVFLHTCEEDGTFVSYFVPADNKEHCEKSHVDKPECCTSDETEDDDCCGDELKHFKVQLDYFQKISTPFIPIYYSPQPTSLVEFELNEESTTVHNYANPPPKKRSVERSLSQIWII
ncbi:MAG: hypothetical protein HRT58_18710 [Crocinitomicaceae bacterium]|nr:hypothetical protein [Flavobacteriales bacterium]NQZ37703.1 hypothetical protein [Crocinitomicaceae bacterium]